MPDQTAPIDVTLAAVKELAREGRVHQIGISKYRASLVRAADATSGRDGIARFVSVQNQYNLLERTVESELLLVAPELGLAFVPYFPSANGLLTGK